MSLNCIADLPLAIAKAEELLKINNCDKPPIDPSDIARKIGIKVMDCSFENPNISGYYDFDEKTIYVNIYKTKIICILFLAFTLNFDVS